MPHSYNKIWIHAIWSTKNREPLIKSDFEKNLHNYLQSQLKEQGCKVSIINGMSDHVHCLFLLNSQKSISDVIKQIKGSSSHYINQLGITDYKFAWQTGYAAFSVSESVFKKVYYYINNQKQHHSSKTFENEYESFLKLNGLE
jgi:putative transposase